MAATLTEVVNVSSVIEFVDKHGEEESPLNGDVVSDGENIYCQIPDLYIGEVILLNAYGVFEVHHYDGHRRRLGVYSVVEKIGDENPHYVFQREASFSESELIHASLLGDLIRLTGDTKGLKYIALDRDGHTLSDD